MAKKKTGLVSVKLSDYMDRLGTEGSIEIEVDDGDPIVLPNPVLWPIRVHELLNDGADPSQSKTEYEVEVAQLIVGEDGWARFEAAGGNWAIFGSLLKDRHGIALGESQAS